MVNQGTEESFKLEPVNLEVEPPSVEAINLGSWSFLMDVNFEELH